jgi:putative transposase
VEERKRKLPFLSFPIFLVFLFVFKENKGVLEQYGRKYELFPVDDQPQRFAQVAGGCRWVWNEGMNLYCEARKEDVWLSPFDLNSMLPFWKRQEATAWLKQMPSQVLQQVFKDFGEACDRFYAGLCGAPKFKRRGDCTESFRFPQGFEFDERSSRVYLPKIGWVRYDNHRPLDGIPTNVTVSRKAKRWFLSVQCEREVFTPSHPSNTAVGLDLGCTATVYESDGVLFPSLRAFRTCEEKMAFLQKELSLKVKGSQNYEKCKAKIAQLHIRIANMRKDFLHKVSHCISKNHAIVIMEDLNVKTMSASASGTVEEPGTNVAQKSGLNKSILDQGWGMFKTMLKYKCKREGGLLLFVNPAFTSQTCFRCKHVAEANRVTQSLFRCVACGHTANADYNAAQNIRAAGLVAYAREIAEFNRQRSRNRLSKPIAV